MSESSLMREIQLALTKAGCVLFRNNCGQYQYAPGKYIRYGIANPGGSDLIGWYKGRFTAIEIKTPIGKLTKEQARFLHAVQLAGGIAFMARSVEDALDYFRRHITREAVERGNAAGLQGSGSGAPKQGSGVPD